VPYKNINSEAAKQSRKRAQKKYYETHREEQIAATRAWEKAHPEQHKKNKKAYMRRHPEKRAKEWKRYMGKHGDERRKSRREKYAADPSKDKQYAQTHKEQINKRMKNWSSLNKGKISGYAKKRQRRNKELVIAAYGGKCFCCGETLFEVLTIDHIKGNGRADRKGRGGSAFYAWLVRNNFPKDEYRLACMNCNFAIGIYGHCPHKPTATALP
jgi:hypothetical protein